MEAMDGGDERHGGPTTGRGPAPVGATESSGDALADPVLVDPEEALAEAELAQQIGALLTERGLTHAEAAALLGGDQPEVSALVRGRPEGRGPPGAPPRAGAVVAPGGFPGAARPFPITAGASSASGRLP
jgi:predicted XRE-type DNA-binding protein